MEGYLKEAALFSCKEYKNVSIKNFPEDQIFSQNIYNFLYNNEGEQKIHFCKTIEDKNKEKCKLTMDKVPIYDFFGYRICDESLKTEDFMKTWGTLSTLYDENLSTKNSSNDNDDTVEAIFSNDVYANYKKMNFSEKLIKLIWLNNEVIKRRKGYEVTKYIKHSLEARRILGSSYVLNSFPITAIQAEKMFSTKCDFVEDNINNNIERHIQCNLTTEETNPKRKRFRVFVEYNYYRTIITVILILIGFLVNFYISFLIKKSWKKLNLEYRILITCFVTAYIIFLLTKLYHNFRQFTSNDYLSHEIHDYGYDDPGISIVNETFILNIWALFYTFNESGITIATEETIFRCTTQLTCIIGFVIMVNTFADILYLKQGKQKEKKYYNLSMTFLISVLFGLGILILFILSSIFTYDKIKKFVAEINNVSDLTVFYEKLCDSSEVLLDAQFGITLYSWTSFSFLIVYTLLTIIFLFYYKIETRTSNMNECISKDKDLKHAVETLVGGYITYMISNAFCDYEMMQLILSKGNPAPNKRTFELAEHAMFYQMYSILFLINPIVQPILIIYRLSTLKKQHIILWHQFWTASPFKNFTNLLWYPIEKMYVGLKKFKYRRFIENRKVDLKNSKSILILTKNHIIKRKNEKNNANVTFNNN
uniref:G_PROTEIN_RECEP_F3_4 domain-containing protein n=1 Tax=Parastrongyloides trichosuri TaxID=131310 RepID=A0A0N4ZBX2_PARTI